MGHKGTIEARYTTNKGILPESLTNEMREAFKRSEEFLDLEVKEEDPFLKRKEEIKTTIDKATPEQMQQILQLLQSTCIGCSKSSNKRRMRAANSSGLEIYWHIT